MIKYTMKDDLWYAALHKGDEISLRKIQNIERHDFSVQLIKNCKNRSVEVIDNDLFLELVECKVYLTFAI